MSGRARAAERPTDRQTDRPAGRSRGASATSAALTALGLVRVSRVDGKRASALSALVPPAMHPAVRVVDVRGDGQCGPYVLSIVHFALTRRILRPPQVREMLHTLVERAVMAAPGDLRAAEVARFRSEFDAVARRAWLNDTEIVAFLHAHRLSVAIVSRARRRALVVTHPWPRCVGWVVVIHTNGNHWQLLARGPAHAHGFDPIWPRAAGAELIVALSQRASAVVDGSSPLRTYTARVGDVPNFSLDFADRVWNGA